MGGHSWAEPSLELSKGEKRKGVFIATIVVIDTDRH